MIEISVNWEDPALKRWLDPIVRKSTKYGYKTAFKAYAYFTAMTASELIDEALDDLRKDPRERQDVVLTKLVRFYHWLKTEYPKSSRGKGEHQVIAKGVSDKMAHFFVNAVRSFYATFDVTVRMRGRHRLPKPRVENKRMKVGAEQVKLLVDHARTPRDRAIILILFQSGMDVSTLCSLKYGDVADGLANDQNPLKLDLYRPKTGTDYYTFLGKDAVEVLKAYIADAKERGVQFKPSTSLFIKERGKQPLETNLVQNMLKAVALQLLQPSNGQKHATTILHNHKQNRSPGPRRVSISRMAQKRKSKHTHKRGHQSGVWRTTTRRRIQGNIQDSRR